MGALKDLDSPAYSSLAQKFKHYASCVGLVDTGYFRKRSKKEMSFSNSIQPPPEFNMGVETDLSDSRDSYVLNAALDGIQKLEHLLRKIREVKEELEHVKTGLLKGHHVCNYIDCPKPKPKVKNNLPSQPYKNLFLSKYFDFVKDYDGILDE